MIQPITVQQLIERFGREKPKYICLKNSRNEISVAWNSVQIRSEKRFEDVKEYLNRQSTEDGIYYFVTKDYLGRKYPEHSTAIGKGNYNGALAELNNKKETIVIQERPQAADPKRESRYYDDLLDKNTTIIELQFEVRRLQEENRDLRNKLNEFEELAEDEPEEGGSSQNFKGVMSGLKEMIETIVVPLADKHFDLKEKQLKVDQEKISIYKSIKAPAVRANGMREDGGLPVEDARYLTYFDGVMEKGTEEQINIELDYLEQANPQLYEELCQKYEIEMDGGDENVNG